MWMGLTLLAVEAVEEGGGLFDFERYATFNGDSVFDFDDGS